MKTVIVLIVSIIGLALGGCAERPLYTDEEYNAMRGPAPYSPDPMMHIPQPTSRMTGY